VTLSILIITHNEEANLGRALESVKALVSDGKGEIIVVDSGSTDRTVEIANSFGAKVFVEGWKGYAAQKNSAIDKVIGDWILSLDADEALGPELLKEIERALGEQSNLRRISSCRGESNTAVSGRIGRFAFSAKTRGALPRGRFTKAFR